MLVAEAVSRTLIVADQAGSVGLFVDAKDRDAIAFYEHFGFVHIPDRPSQLFLPIKTLRASQSGT